VSTEPELQEGPADLPARADPSGIAGSELLPSVEGEFESATHAAPDAKSQWALFRRRFLRHKVALASILVLIVIAILCFGASFFAPYKATDQDLLLGPVSPNGEHWFGTDEVGADLLSRVLYAGQISLKIGFAVAIISTFIGTAVGAIAGYFGRGADQALMRLTDLFLIVPDIAILAIVLERFGHGDTVIVLVLAGLFWMYIARVVRGEVLSLKEKEFVEAARASGASSTRIIVRHIVPNIVGPIVVNVTLYVALAIIAESTLSFLGFGVQPPQASWGSMLNEYQGYIGGDKAYLIYAPALMILIVVLCVNFIGDGLRDAFDPQSEKHA
jgi:peptide/nickel transport system permease protein